MSFEEFVDKILEYESDTFTSSGEGLTLEQAQEIAKILLKNWVDTHLDGTVISAALFDL